MKSLIILLLSLYAVGAYADKLDCTTRFLNTRTDKTPKVKICGAVSLDRAFDNGIKYRKKPRFCNKFEVEFFSIREHDDAKFSTYCTEINSKNCYMVGIRDKDDHQGIGYLSSHIVFPNITSMPTTFSLKGHGIGHNTSASPRPGRIVEITLSCRKSKK